MSKHLIRKLTLFLLLCAGLIPVATAATVEELLAAFDRNQDLTTANRFLKALYDEGQMDELLQYPAGTAVDTLRREVWCWAADWFFSNQHYDRSEEYGLKALPLFADSTRERSDCLNTLACADMRLGHFLKAADYATRSLNIELFLGDADVISSSMNTLAAIYMAANQPHEAKRYILSGLDYAGRANNPGRRAILLGSASEIFHVLGNDSTALAYAEQALQIEHQLGREPKAAIRRAQKASALIGLKRFDEAEAELRAAIPVFRQVGNVQSLGISLNNLGRVSYQEEHFVQAVAYFREAAAIFAQIGDLYNALHSHQGLYESLWTLNPDSAKIELELFNSLKDSLYSHATADALARYNAEFDNDLLQQEKDQERRIRHRDSIFALVVLVILAFAFWFTQWLNSRRQRRLIHEIEQLHKRLLSYAEANGNAGGQAETTGGATQDEVSEPDEDQRFLMRVIEVVNESLPQGTYGVEAIASKLNMSVQTFRRRMKTAANESPKTFIQAIQIEKAGKLLTAHSKMPVTEVARLCGFDEVSSFTRVFKRILGISPTEYRDRQGP